jgi:hypothetical protein
LRYTSVCFIVNNCERGVIVFEFFVLFCIFALIWGALLSPSSTNGNGEHFEEDTENTETYTKQIEPNKADTASTIASLVWSVVFACALLYSALVCHYVVLVPLFFH